MESADTDTFLEDVQRFEGEYFLASFDVEEAVSCLAEGALVGLCEIDDFVEELSEEAVAIFVFALGHGDVFVVIQFLVAYFSGCQDQFLHIGVCIY